MYAERFLIAAPLALALLALNQASVAAPASNPAGMTQPHKPSDGVMAPATGPEAAPDQPASLRDPATTPGTMSASPAANSEPAAAPAMTDDQFASKALQAGAQEVADAQYAKQHASRAEVRDIAQLLMTDHKNANRQLAKLTKRAEPAIPSPMAMPAAKGPTGKAPGRQFDASYVAAQIRHHEEAIAMFRRQAKSGQSAPLRQFAAETLPTLQEHLAALQRLQP